jgi:tRNA threonylcarbamoyladenosine biosynthesis protein TsaE
METVTIPTVADLTATVPALLAAGQKARPHDKALVVALSGPLGAGKTTLSQQIAAALGVTETVVSPTFVIMKHYALPTGQPFATLTHIDAYRLDDPAELTVLGWADLVADPTRLILLEWPERVAPLLPPETFRITLTAPAVGSRTLTYGS